MRIKKTKKLGLFTLAIIWMLSAVAASDKQAENKNKAVADINAFRTEKMLSIEYALARKQKFYFVLDLRQQTLELKVKGMIMRSWSVQSVRFWGKPAFSGKNETLELVRKSSLKVPERNVIKPGQAQKPAADPTKFELKALELKDMPERFDLIFQTGLQIAIKVSGRGNIFRKITNGFYWHLILPVKNFFGTRSGKPLSILEITFKDKDDAKSIYWSFFEGIEGFVR